MHVINRRWLFVFSLLWLCAFALRVDAQTVITNPTQAVFTPSPDHNATEYGQPIVARYEFLFFRQGATQPEQVVNLGKPSPVSNQITIDFRAITRPITWSTETYSVSIRAVGPGGNSPEVAGDNPFNFRPATVPQAVPGLVLNTVKLTETTTAYVLHVHVTCGDRLLGAETVTVRVYR